jgi:hypothetical protein
VVADVAAAGVEAVLVAFDIESLTGAPPCGNDYVAALRDRHPGTFIQAWGAVDPLKGEAAVADAIAAVRDHHVLGFHFHPIMGHFAVDEPALNPLFETIAGLRVPVMIDVGTTGMGAGLPGGLGARLEHARPLAIDNLAARFPALTIIAAHPGWPWTDEMSAVALHKGTSTGSFPAGRRSTSRRRCAPTSAAGCATRSCSAVTTRACRTTASCGNGTNSVTMGRSWTSSSTPTRNASWACERYGRPATTAGSLHNANFC